MTEVRWLLQSVIGGVTVTTDIVAGITTTTGPVDRVFTIAADEWAGTLHDRACRVIEIVTGS